VSRLKDSCANWRDSMKNNSTETTVYRIIDFGGSDNNRLCMYTVQSWPYNCIIFGFSIDGNDGILAQSESNGKRQKISLLNGN
jgi:hypothetical protein